MDKRLALKLRLNKIDDCGISASLLLHESIKNSTLVQGYFTIQGETCWHVVVSHEDTILDMGYQLACLQDPEFLKCPVSFSRDEPESYKKNDDIIKQWDLYQSDRRAYWKQTSKKVREFRSKLLSK